MQNFQDFIARPRDHGAGLGLGGPVLANQNGLCELQIPIAVDVPDETVDFAGGVIETIGFDGRGDLARSARGLVNDPSVERFLRGGRIELGGNGAFVHFRKAAGVPELGRKIAITFDPLRRQLDVTALRCHRREREAQRIGAVFVDQMQGIDDVALRLRHLCTALVADERVNIDLREWRFLHEVETHHHHPGDPEEDDVETRDQHVGRIVAFQLRRRVRPAERRERPERRREPGVEHILVA